MVGTNFINLAEAYPELMDAAQKCGITMDELNDCIKAVSVLQSAGYTIKNVEEAAKDMSKVLKKLKEQEKKLKTIKSWD